MKRLLILLALALLPVAANAQTSFFTAHFDLSNQRGQVQVLQYLGHYNGDFQAAIDSFRKYSRYDIVGEVVPVGPWCEADAKSLAARSCDCPDIRPANTRKGHWDEKQVFILTTVRGAPANFGDSYLKGGQEWSKVCGLDFAGTTTFRDADIWGTYQRIDGANGTLAWSMLPSANQKHGTRQMQQRYDSGERFTVTGDWGRNSWFGTIVHEHGHAIGIDHVPIDRRNPGTNVMEAFLGDQDGFGPLDIAEAVERYGKVGVNPDPPVEPPANPPTNPSDGFTPWAIEFQSETELKLKREKNEAGR